MGKRRARSRVSRRHDLRRRDDGMISEDEEMGIIGRADAESEPAYEFDVQLKVWRRSRANVWRPPSFD